MTKTIAKNLIKITFPSIIKGLTYQFKTQKKTVGASSSQIRVSESSKNGSLSVDNFGVAVY